MRRPGLIILVLLAELTCATTARSDQEASNVAHVVADPYGRCYAKSVPDHIYDPDDGPRQQGRTFVYRVENGKDVLVQEYDWFAQRLFVRCRPPDNVSVVRVGPWHRGHDLHNDHLAIAFYNNDRLVKRYSTLDIAVPDKTGRTTYSINKNVLASVSHYTVFEKQPDLKKTTTMHGNVFKEQWDVVATAVDGRKLTFDIETGELR